MSIGITWEERQARIAQMEGGTITREDIIEDCLTEPAAMKQMLADFLSDELVGALLLLYKRKDGGTLGKLCAVECVIKSLEDMARKAADFSGANHDQ